MYKIKYLIKCCISIIINAIVYFISILIPKSSKILVFGGWFGQRFADNSRYLYLYCVENKDKLGFKKVIWITENNQVYNSLKEMKLEVYKKWSIKSIFYHLRAKYVFVDQGSSDVNKYFCVRSKKINLWHGFPLKKIGKLSDNINFNLDDIYNKYFKLGGWSNYYIQVTSPLSKEILTKAFAIDNEKTIMSGYARNDVFTSNYWKKYLTSYEVDIINKIEIYKNEGYKIIFYLPTFRDNKEMNLFNINSNDEIEKIKCFLDENKIILITKQHYAQSKNTININHNCMINLNSDLDIYPILSYSDILITDYSSVYFDYLISNRPIIFYSFDIEEYRDSSKSRGLLFDYNEFTPGVKVKNLSELMNEIKNILNDESKYMNEYNSQYKLIRDKVFDKNIVNNAYSTIIQINNIC